MQRAAAGALRTLAFKNEENKNQIVECGALPTLIQMLQADDAGIHYEAVGVIGNLVHSSIHIKRQVGSQPCQPAGLLNSPSFAACERRARLDWYRPPCATTSAQLGFRACPLGPL